MGDYDIVTEAERCEVVRVEWFVLTAGTLDVSDNVLFREEHVFPTKEAAVQCAKNHTAAGFFDVRVP